MESPSDNGKLLSPTPRYSEVMGRAAEIARTRGTPAGPEHLFLGMLHAGGWPVCLLEPLVDLGQAEAAVLEIIGGADYAPPPATRFPQPEGWLPPWGEDIASAEDDDYLGLEHALLALIRARETIPSRALAGLAGLGALEAAVLEARNAPSAAPAGSVFVPGGLLSDGPLNRALFAALPPETTIGFNRDDQGRTWIHAFGQRATGRLAGRCQPGPPVPVPVPVVVPAQRGHAAHQDAA